MSTFSPTAPPLSPEKAGEPQETLDEYLGFLDAFPAPLSIRIGETSYNVSPLTTDDYLSWLTEETIKGREARMKLIPPTAQAVDRWKISANIAEWEMVPEDIAVLVFRPVWTKRVIMTALGKAGVPESDCEKFYKSLPAKANEQLAVRFSGLYTETQINRIYQPTIPKVVGGAVPFAKPPGQNDS